MGVQKPLRGPGGTLSGLDSGAPSSLGTAVPTSLLGEKACGEQEHLVTQACVPGSRGWKGGRPHIAIRASEGRCWGSLPRLLKGKLWACPSSQEPWRDPQPQTSGSPRAGSLSVPPMVP